MRRPICASLFATMLLAACAQSHMMPGEGDPETVDPDVDPEVGGEGPGSTPEDLVIACGPNFCRDGEVCCNELCGVCTAPDACIAEVGCASPVAVCSGIVCDVNFGGTFCCPSCEGDVCPPAGVDERSGCPPVTCE